MAWPLVAAVVAGSVISGALGAKGAKDAAKEQRKGAEAGQKLLADAAERARADVIPLFRQAQRDAQAGFQAGLGVIGQAVPAQIDAMQQGNVAAQETRIAGMDPFRSAILGQQPDLSGLQPRKFDVDTSFLQQNIPVTPPPSEQALGFQSLMEEIRKDPVAAKQFFDQVKLDQRESFFSGVPLGDIRAPAPPPRNQVGGIRAGT